MTVSKLKVGFCGLASYRPQYLQKFATGFWFTVFSCLVVLIQGLYFGYTVGMLTTIEKRFKINSFRSGSLLSSYDMGHAVSVLLIGHFGPWLHKPKWVAFGCLSNALACFGMAASHFLFKSDHEADVVKFWTNEPAAATDGSSNLELCSMGNNESITTSSFLTSTSSSTGVLIGENSNGNQNADWWAFITLLSFQFVCGISSSPFTTLTYVYIDDNANPKHAPFYFGLVTAMWGYGPAVGFGLAVVCTQVYVTLLEPPNFLTPSSAHWIGAWWLGFLCLSIMYIVVGLPFFCYPSKLRTSRKFRAADEYGPSDTVHRDETMENFVLGAFSSLPAIKSCEEINVYDANHGLRWFWERFLEIPKQVVKMIKNKIFICITGSWIFWSYVIGGYSTFLPKYLEVHFHQPSHFASTYGGFLTAFAAATSCAIGGKLLSILGLKPYKSNFLIALCTCSAALSYLAFIAIDCPRPDVASMTWNSSLPCNSECRCDTSNYEPVCAGDEVYFSPCLAGCRELENRTDGEVQYKLCQCPQASSSARPGFCSENCYSKMVTYLVGTILTAITVQLFQVAQFTTLIKSVTPEEKSMVYALANFFTSMLGFLPSQILFGRVIDTTCVKWSSPSAASRHCQLYDRSLFRSRYHLLTAAFAGLSFLCVAFTSLFAVKFSFFQ